MKMRKMKKRNMKRIELILLGMLLLLLITIILNISIALDLIVSANIIKAPDKDNMSINNQLQQVFLEAHFDLLQQQRIYTSSSSSSNHTESKEDDMKSIVSRNVSKPTPKLLRQAVGLEPRIQCHLPEKNVPWILDGTCKAVRIEIRTIAILVDFCFMADLAPSRRELSNEVLKNKKFQFASSPIFGNIWYDRASLEFYHWY